ncbi:hypothetical protein SAMN04490202_0138 [Pseudomonas reinekei]|uniref:Uncharacterized protein n=1 Tax=Pseudomonas reinekei TaxID=395598 RepID=A0A1H0HL23_PSERE|nr:hypothetical protein SAMN04490202_0138 [Pseudomonas reinekei]
MARGRDEPPLKRRPVRSQSVLAILQFEPTLFA